MEQPANDHKTEQKTARKPYLKPRVKRVNLVVKEAVLASGCKTLSGMAAAGSLSSCNPTPAPTCRDFGS